MARTRRVSSGVPSLARDLEGRAILITGANTGIGRATAIQLAGRGARVVLACRSEERTRPVLEAIRSAPGTQASFVRLDLASFASVRDCAARVASTVGPLDVLINNAGQAAHRGLTADGFELAFGTNHLGHFLLTMLLFGRIRGRIVNVSSQAHYEAKGIDFDAIRKPTRTVTGIREYEISKLANVLFTREMARRVGSAGVHTYALHPGVVASDAWRRMPWPIRPLMKMRMISNEEGAKTSLYCATSSECAGDNGLYYDACNTKRPSAVAEDAELARRLWDRSVEFTGADLP